MKQWLIRKVHPWIPLYLIVPAAVCLAFNALVYNGSRALMGGKPHYDLTTALDRAIPFHPGWVWIYIASFAFWAVGYIMVARQGRTHWYRYVATVLMAKAVCGLCFLLLPTTNVRPELLEETGWLMRLVYRLDDPTELFPSIHCLESWLCYLGVRGQKRCPKWYPGFACVSAVLIFASTQFTKQHYLIDIPAAVLIAEGAWFLTGRLDLGRFAQKAGNAAERVLFGTNPGEDGYGE